MRGQNSTSPALRNSTYQGSSVLNYLDFNNPGYLVKLKPCPLPLNKKKNVPSLCHLFNKSLRLGVGSLTMETCSRCAKT